MPKEVPAYIPDSAPARRRKPLEWKVWTDNRQSGPFFTFHLRPRVVQYHHPTCKLLCCLSGSPTPTVRFPCSVLDRCLFILRLEGCWLNLLWKVVRSENCQSERNYWNSVKAYAFPKWNFRRSSGTREPRSWASTSTTSRMLTAWSQWRLWIANRQTQENIAAWPRTPWEQTRRVV